MKPDAKTLETATAAINHLGMTVTDDTDDILICAIGEEDTPAYRTIAMLVIEKQQVLTQNRGMFGIEEAEAILTWYNWARLAAYRTDSAMAVTVYGSKVMFHDLRDETEYDWSEERGKKESKKSVVLKDANAFIRIDVNRQ